jgi:hypothetical protein
LDFQDRVAVIGSGPSCPFVTPLEDLVKRLEKSCHVRKTSSEYHWDFCERAYAKNATKYFEEIQRSFGNTPEWDARAYKHLVAINFRSYVTFNYDDQLPNAFRTKLGPEFSDSFRVYPARNTEKFFLPSDLVGHKPRLAAIHGYKNDADSLWHKKLILRVSDYNEHYGDGTRPDGTSRFPELYGWWHTLLTTQPCVFIGISLREPGLHNVITDLVKDENPALKEQSHIHLKHTERMPESPFYESPGTSLFVIRQVLYDKVDTNFTGLLDVLSAFSNIPAGRPVPKMPKRTPIAINCKYPEF